MSRLLVQARRHDARFELNVDFSVDNGTLVLFGASGAGKTSTLNAIAGLLSLNDGKIQIDPMITHVLSLEEINKGFELMHAGESIRSVVVY